MHRFLAGPVVVAGLVLATCSLRDTPLVVRAQHPGRAPELLMDDSVAYDLRSLAEETWGRFLATFLARSSCFGDVRLHATRDLDDRGAYDPSTATVTVRVPASPVMLQGALVHEWAHHMEFSCDAHSVLRPAFLAAQGLPAGTPWRAGNARASGSESGWAEVPSEQYAEAVIELVLGRRQIPTTARVGVDAVRVVRDWAAGR